MVEASTGLVRLRQLAYLNVGYLVLVIVWGAYVRISFSGDGCGDHWPLCQGRLVPAVSDHHTAVELLHRVTSAACGLFALGLLALARRATPPGHLARRHAAMLLGFVVVEGLLGAALVRLRLVGHDTSVLRAYVMAIHLANTFGLLASATALAERARVQGTPPSGSLGLLAGGFALLVLIGASGAIAALGDTLFPARSFRAGLVADFDPDAHFLVQLRVFHPMFALLGAAVLAHFAASRLADPVIDVRIASRGLLGLVVAQVALGFLNLLLNAPQVAQLAHLAFADAVLVAFVALMLRVRGATVEAAVTHAG